ncbi:MAG: epoxyqueuosine reductase QueH [Acutalibacteraceae bacterium]
MAEFNKVNFQREMDALLEKNKSLGLVPKLLLHSCCAPCSSYVIEYLSDYFEITVFYYNPNLYPDDEYEIRSGEQKRFISEFKSKYPLSYLDAEFIPNEFYSRVKGLENEKEGGKRCEKCFELRLEKTAALAKEKDFDYFATTLTISPLKNAALINKIGSELSEKYGVRYLASDFKKKNGFKRSTELSRQYNLYRQDYCGCVFSKRERTEKCGKCTE